MGRDKQKSDKEGVWNNGLFKGEEEKQDESNRYYTILGESEEIKDDDQDKARVKLLQIVLIIKRWVMSPKECYRTKRAAALKLSYAKLSTGQTW